MAGQQHLCLIICLRMAPAIQWAKKGGTTFIDGAPDHRVTALRSPLVKRTYRLSLVHSLVNQLAIIAKKYSRCMQFFFGSGYKLIACVCVRSILTLVLFSGAQREERKKERIGRYLLVVAQKFDFAMKKKKRFIYFKNLFLAANLS